MTTPAKNPLETQTPAKGLTVAVTGPTGEIGRSLLAALERSDQVARVLGMARRPFDPAAHGWTKVEYRRGDVLDRESVDALVADADVVVHLAFIIFGDREQTRTINLEGTRNVFEAVVAAGTRRLVYTSSIAAYGFHPDNPEVLTEDVEPRGTEDFYYSAQKSELEGLLHELLDGAGIEEYIFRPCIVGGRDAPVLINDVVKRFQVGGRLPVERDLVGILPAVSPVLPESGTPMQMVHHDDCADALVAAIEGRGAPGVYNLAADGTITMTDIARELGWRTIPVPGVAVKATAELVRRLGSLLPQEFGWINIARASLIMDTDKAQRELGWRPRYDAEQTMRETIAGARDAGIV
jgi:nucleoside-diphosphate-sugar epimerase